jgi:outer membrane immunogenic protein
MSSRRALLATGVFLGLTGGALAADVVRPVPVIPPPPPNWTGLYVGGHIGPGWSDSSVSRHDGPPGPPGFNLSTDPSGLLGGAQVGYDWQTGHWVFGLVADASLAAINGEDEELTGGPPAAFRTEYQWLATIRARAGFLLNPLSLLYIHGGFASANINLHGIHGAGPWAFETNDKNHSGWVLGIGWEKQMTQNVSLFAEYSFMHFDRHSFTPSGPPGDISHTNKLNVVKLGANFKFH